MPNVARKLLRSMSTISSRSTRSATIGALPSQDIKKEAGEMPIVAAKRVEVNLEMFGRWPLHRYISERILGSMLDCFISAKPIGISKIVLMSDIDQVVNVDICILQSDITIGNMTYSASRNKMTAKRIKLQSVVNLELSAGKKTALSEISLDKPILFGANQVKIEIYDETREHKLESVACFLTVVV